MARVIVSRQNQWIKDIRRLRRSKGDRALLEGPHLLRAARESGLEIEVVLVTPEAAADPATADLIESSSSQMVRADILASVADSDSPRGLAAIARLPRGGVDKLPAAGGGIYLYVDGVQQPGNVGALARVAEAAGAAGLALGPGSAHPNHPRALRASAGSLLRLAVARDVTPTELADHLEEPATWFALSPRGGESLYEAELPAGPLVVLVGGEGQGLAAATLEAAHRRLTLPMRAPVESLNVTVAAALALFEIARQRDGGASPVP